LKGNVTNLDVEITALQTNLRVGLENYITSFEDNMYCLFVSERFDELYMNVCGHVMPSFTMISLMLFLLGLFLIPMNICLILLSKKLRAKSRSAVIAQQKIANKKV
jgi:hypothetical protein